MLTKQGHQLRSGGGISYTRVRELLLEKLAEVGLLEESVSLTL